MTQNTKNDYPSSVKGGSSSVGVSRGNLNTGIQSISHSNQNTFSQITLFNSTILVYLKHYTMVRDWSVGSCVRFSRISYVGHVTYETFKICDRIIVSILK